MSWEQLIAIKKEAQELLEHERANPSPACPLCGTVLDVNDRGVRNCPLGHYRDQGVPHAGR